MSSFAPSWPWISLLLRRPQRPDKGPHPGRRGPIYTDGSGQHWSGREKLAKSPGSPALRRLQPPPPEPSKNTFRGEPRDAAAWGSPVGLDGPDNLLIRESWRQKGRLRSGGHFRRQGPTRRQPADENRPRLQSFLSFLADPRLVSKQFRENRLRSLLAGCRCPEFGEPQTLCTQAFQPRRDSRWRDHQAPRQITLGLARPRACDEFPKETAEVVLGVSGWATHNLLSFQNRGGK